MTTVRKGLSLRVQNQHVLKEKNISSSPMKKVAQHVSEPTKLKQTAADPRLRGAELRLPFKIYEDLENDCCQHCGQHKTANKVPNNNAKLKTADIETQTLGELNDLLCADTPPQSYWEELAEQRRVALKETLDENKELCDLVEALNKEIERLSTISSQAKQFADAYYTLTGPLPENS